MTFGLAEKLQSRTSLATFTFSTNSPSIRRKCSACDRPSKIHWSLPQKIHTQRYVAGRTKAILDESPPWTPDQIAGLAFGVFLLLCVYFAKEVDTIVARSQRKQLGLCVECGGLFEPETCQEWRCPYQDDKSAGA